MNQLQAVRLQPGEAIPATYSYVHEFTTVLIVKAARS